MIETTYYVPRTPYLALLGDFHNGDADSVLASLHKHKPELICIVGDIVYAKVPDSGLVLENQRHVRTLLNGCANITPTFLSLGNHEAVLCNKDWDILKSTGVEILDNEWKQWNGICIGGLTSHYVLRRRKYVPMDQYPKKGKSYPKMIIKPDLRWMRPVPDCYTILLSHHPEYYPLVPDVKMVLSAHAHGGQIRLFHKGLYAPGQGWFPKYTKGKYGRMIITAGLTNTANIRRINNPTEIVYVRPAPKKYIQVQGKRARMKTVVVNEE